ncbi:MAG TPA: carbon monoxide dehydrogenase subunit G [Ramlibacter sp.]|nr:carbon monoxide dehydrogenase subunit G [Ramlibacter sp.]
MKLSNQQSLPVPQATAWEALNDVAILQSCIPGCESLQPLGDDRYEVIVQAAIGPVKARFKGQLALSDFHPPHSYRLAFEGQGGAAGHGKGSAGVRLVAAGPDETVLHYDATAMVGGKIAQIGQRLVDMAAQRMAAEFFSKFEAQLRARHAPEDTAAEPAHEETGRLRRWLNRMTGSRSESEPVS